MEVQGKIKVINETQTFGTNGFRKREIVITTAEQYPQNILIEFVQDKCDILDKYKVGQDVEIRVNLRGREWINPEGETKYFNSIQGWSITGIALGDIPPVAPAEAFEPATNINEEDHDDLPF